MSFEKKIEKEMEGSLKNIFCCDDFDDSSVVIQVECLSEPWCGIKCDVLCLGKRLVSDFDKCVKDCKATKC